MYDIKFSIRCYAARYLYGARKLSGRMQDSQIREPGFEPTLIPFRSLEIFVLSTMPQFIHL